MSIETQIEELTAAIAGLTDAITQAGIGSADTVPSKKTAAKKPAAKKPAAKEVEDDDLGDAGVEDDDLGEDTVDYKAVEKAILTLAKTAVPNGRAKCVAILKKHGAKKGPELKEKDYPAVLAKLNAAIEELTDGDL